MAHGFTESLDGLRYEEHISIALRLFAGVIGLSMFIIPVPFLLHVDWSTPWLHKLLGLVCVVVPCLMGGLFLALALCRPRQLQFDTRRRLLLRTSRWPLGRRDVSISYAQLSALDVEQRESEEGPYYLVRLGVQGEKPMQLGAFDTLAEAELWRGRIAAQLQT